MNNWYTSKVIDGNRDGRKIGYPTINIENPDLLKDEKQGVYLAQVRFDEKNHWGMLYLGPRTVRGETKIILEIHLLEFEGDLYGKEVQFRLYEYLRPVITFKSFEELKSQLGKDRRDCIDFIKSVVSA